MQSITTILTILIFLITFLSVFFELSYRQSKKAWLQSLKNKDTLPTTKSLKHLAEKLNWPAGVVLPTIFNYKHIQTLLQKSGRPFNLTIKNFITLHRLLSDFGLLLAIFVFFTTGNHWTGLFLAITFWFLLAYLPVLWLKALINRRTQNFNRYFSSFIDMLSLTVNAGMSFENALFFVADKFTGIIHEEFKYVQYEMNFGHSLKTALENLSSRLDSTDLKRFVTAINQSKTLGNPISKTLETQSKLILTSRIQKAEELSRTASIKISLPLVFFIFPALLILYLVPAILQFMAR